MENVLLDINSLTIQYKTGKGIVTALDAVDLKMGENQLLARVVKAFESSGARLLPQLQEAHANGDLDGVRHVTHTLKSSSASIGAIKLSQLCADIETKIRTNHPEKLDDRIDALCAEAAIVLQALKRLLDAK